MILGIDIGNSESSIAYVRGSGISALTIPSYIGYGDYDQLKRIRDLLGTTPSPDEYVLEYDGGSSFVGRLALEQSNRPDSGRDDIARYWNGFSRKFMFTLIAASHPGKNCIDAHIVTGLPSEVWTKENVKKVRSNLKGSHTFTLNDRDVQVNIHGVMVLMESFGVGAMKKDIDGTIGIIDIGGRTTDLYAADEAGPIARKCAGISIGVEDIGNRLSKWFEATYDQRLTPAVVRNVLHSYTTGKPHKTIHANQQKIDLRGKTKEFVREVGAEIVSFVRKTWASSERGSVAGDFSSIDLIGGGAYYFREAIDRIVHLNPQMNKPELANARSYVQVGLSLPDEAWAKA